MKQLSEEQVEEVNGASGLTDYAVAAGTGAAEGALVGAEAGPLGAFSGAVLGGIAGSGSFVFHELL